MESLDHSMLPALRYQDYDCASNSAINSYNVQANKRVPCLSVACLGNTERPVRWHQHARQDTVSHLLAVGGTWAGLSSGRRTWSKARQVVMRSRGPDQLQATTQRQLIVCATLARVLLACMISESLCLHCIRVPQDTMLVVAVQLGQCQWYLHRPHSVMWKLTARTGFSFS
jgi:hypothetical protein